MMGQETMVNEDEEEFSSRPTGALLPPKELWYTSPELIEIFRIQGRQRGSTIPLTYNAKDLGKGPRICKKNNSIPYVILKQLACLHLNY